MRYGIKIIFLFFTLTILAGCSKLPVASKNGRLYTLAFYNVEDLYDTGNDPQTDDDAYTPTGAKAWTEERYDTKLKRIANVIAGIGGSDGPAVIGLSEIENRQVLEDLVNTSPLRKLKMGIIHYDMADANGLDVALLYQPKFFKPTSTEALKIDFQEKNFSSRDILQVKGELRGERITIYVNHWPSNGVSNGSNQRERRQRSAATALRREINKQQVADPNTKIIVMGDFGIEPNAAAILDVLKANGNPDPAEKETLYNAHYLAFVNGFGSYASRGDLKMPDQIMVSKALLTGEPGLQFVRGSAGIYNASDIKFLFGKYRDTPKRTWSGNLYLGGYSDHFPVYIQLRKER